jgi:DNA helicase-2/ATP-dependent DNA helicase PcrA
MNAETWLSVLNPEQLAAVTHEGSPLLILAGAGSGKTRVITTKIAWLIAERGVEPESILAVTFTNKAAREMAERARLMEGRAERSVLRTFHSFGAWLLRRNAALAGLDSNFTIYDDDDAITLLAKAMPALTRPQVSSICHKISRAKDYCYGPDHLLLAEIDPDPDFAEAYRLYEKRLRETGNLDFGDLILLPVRLLNEHPEVRDRLTRRFSVIMVDEYQDSNVAQFELLKAITGPETYLCVVGDDDQSIYRFRGAEVRNILTFQDSFPGTTIIRLERNYRSVAPILSVAGEVVSNNEGRLGKTLIAERGSGKKPELVFLANQDEEAAFCATMIQTARKKGVPYADWAVLYRMNAQSLGFETEFLHRKIPYRVVGSLKFYEREEIKDALAFLALVANGRDEVAFRRIVNKPARGLGEVTQDKIVDEARRVLFEEPAPGDALDFGEKADLVSASRRLLDTLSKKARSGLSEFIAIVESLRQLLPAAEPPVGDDADPFAASPAFTAGGAIAQSADADAEIAGKARPTVSAGVSTPAGKAQPASRDGPRDSSASVIAQSADAGTETAGKANDLSLSKGASAGVTTETAGKANLSASSGPRDSAALPDPAFHSPALRASSAPSGSLDFGSPETAATADSGKSRKKGAIGLAVFVDKLVESSGLLAYHQGQDEIAGTQRVANLQELVNAASLYPLTREGLTEFLEHIELDRSMADDDENPDSVTLITVHNTKGLEFRRVVITGLESGVFPREDKAGDDLEEERRLMYVGCTRAMDELYLTSCAARRLYGRTAFMEPSRFLSEIPANDLVVSGRAPRSFLSRYPAVGKDASIFAGSRSGGVNHSGETRLAGDSAPREAGRDRSFPGSGAPRDPSGLAEKWKVGQKLFHDDYGYGIISKSFYAGDEFVILVRFETGGEKRFLPKYQGNNLLPVED